MHQWIRNINNTGPDMIKHNDANLNYNAHHVTVILFILLRVTSSYSIILSSTIFTSHVNDTLGKKVTLLVYYLYIKNHVKEKK